MRAPPRDVQPTSSHPARPGPSWDEPLPLAPPTCATAGRCSPDVRRRTRAEAGGTGSLAAGSTPARRARAAARSGHTAAPEQKRPVGSPAGGAGAQTLETLPPVGHPPHWPRHGLRQGFAAALTGTPPNLLTVQAAGPLGDPFTAASRSPSSTVFRTAAITTGRPRDSRSYGGRNVTLSAHARLLLLSCGWLWGWSHYLTYFWVCPGFEILETTGFTSDGLR